MSLSSQEAAASLSEAEKARLRSAQLYSYHKASPHLIMWGIIWVVGYGLTELYPQNWVWHWGVLIAAGTIGGISIGRKTGRWLGEERRGPYPWRMAALSLLAVFFVSATYAIMWPVHGPQFAAYPALISGTAYAAAGLWAGMRYIVIGALVIALTLFGYYYLQEHILLWMAFVGGGSMILAGFWFRTV